MTDSNSWGGSRDGAGRPSLFDENTVRKTLTMPKSVAKYLEQLGDGNTSAGLRKLVQKNTDRD